MISPHCEAFSQRLPLCHNYLAEYVHVVLGNFCELFSPPHRAWSRLTRCHSQGASHPSLSYLLPTYLLVIQSCVIPKRSITVVLPFKSIYLFASSLSLTHIHNSLLLSFSEQTTSCLVCANLYSFPLSPYSLALAHKTHRF